MINFLKSIGLTIIKINREMSTCVLKRSMYEDVDKTIFYQYRIIHPNLGILSNSEDSPQEAWLLARKTMERIYKGLFWIETRIR